MTIIQSEQGNEVMEVTRASLFFLMMNNDSAEVVPGCRQIDMRLPFRKESLIDEANRKEVYQNMIWQPTVLESRV